MCGWPKLVTASQGRDRTERKGLAHTASLQTLRQDTLTHHRLHITPHHRPYSTLILVHNSSSSLTFRPHCRHSCLESNAEQLLLLSLLLLLLFSLLHLRRPFHYRRHHLPYQLPLWSICWPLWPLTPQRCWSTRSPQAREVPTLSQQRRATGLQFGRVQYKCLLTSWNQVEFRQFISDLTRTNAFTHHQCNDLWLQLMTVSLCDGLIRRMYVERERENSAHERGRAYFARPSRVSQLSLALGHVSLPLITYSSPLCLSMLIGSFFVANTTTRHDYAESLQPVFLLCQGQRQVSQDGSGEGGAERASHPA